MSAKQLHASALATPPDTYLYTLARTNTACATIGSDDVLRFFSLPGLEPLHSIPQAHSGISCLTTGADNQTVLTAGRDGHIRAWDSRAKSAAAELLEPKGAGFSAIKAVGTFVAAGTESTKEGLGDVSVLVYDLRSPGQVLRAYNESHTDSITQLSWHPAQPNLLLSGSTDGLVSVFDAEVADEEDALKQVLNPRSAVHCAGFLPDDQVYSISTDEHFSVYGLEKTGTAEEEALPMHEFGDVREKLDCMYVIDLLQQPFLPTPVIAFGHNEKQTLSLVPLQTQDWSFGPRIELPGAHGEEVVRDVMFVDETSALSCGEDGHVRLWGFGDASQKGESEMTADAGAGAGSKKARRKGKKESERFAPY